MDNHGYLSPSLHVSGPTQNELHTENRIPKYCPLHHEPVIPGLDRAVLELYWIYLEILLHERGKDI